MPFSKDFGKNSFWVGVVIEGQVKIFIKKGLEVFPKFKIKFAVCGCTRFACYSQNKRKQRCYLMDNENKFKISISSMLDYELPNIAVRFDDCKTEYILLAHTKATGRFRQNC